MSRSGSMPANGSGWSVQTAPARVRSSVCCARKPSWTAGDVVLPKHVRIGHLHQQLNPHMVNASLLDYTEDSIPELKTIPDEIHRLESSIGSMDDDEKERALRRIGQLQHDFEHLGGYDMRARAEAALGGLGFHEAEFSRPFTSFSGGWQMRAELARTLIANPDLLLLDEPSNFLDSAGGGMAAEIPAGV